MLSGLTLSGCASGDKLLPKQLAVDLPTATCERILTAVPMPKVSDTDDARAAFVRDEAALIIANGRIVAGRDCVADVRRRYGRGKP